LSGPSGALGARLASRAACVGVLGQGYVGLPLAKRFLAAGFGVLGVEPEGSRRAVIEAAGLAGSYRVSADAAGLGTCDVAVVCVPTPLGPDRKPDLGAVCAAGRAVGQFLPDGGLVVLESTTYPGTTRGVFLAAIAEGRKLAGRAAPDDLALAYSPEREDPGRPEAELVATPKLVGGADAASEELAAELYAAAFERVHRTGSCEVAEAAKLFENVFRAVNIALVNEAKCVLEAMDIDVLSVMEAAATKPFGFMPFAPGPGLGGHCIPIDPFYFAWAAEQAGVPARFVELAGEVNRAMPGYVVTRLEAALETRGTALRGARVLVLGLAYKRDVGDLREAPALDLIDKLLLAGADVEAADPHVERATTPGGAEIAAVALDATRLARADAVLIVTDHTAFDYRAIADHARLVVDTRGIMRAFAAELGERLVRA